MGTQKLFGRTWWGNAWVKAMERIDYNTNRLPRGRRYANNGSVLSIQIEEREVIARVQGSRPKPYHIRIRLNEFKAGETGILKDLISDNIAIATDLGLGKLPESMLNLLEERGIHLFPRNWNEISGSCSCPDWANPCKHLAAVYYIIGNEIDKNPFILFNLKGIETEDLCAAGGILPEGSMDDASREQGNYVPYTQLSSADRSPQRQPAVDGSESIAPEVDLAFSPVDADGLYSLLADSPFFYSQGNFKKILIQAYRQMRRSVEDLAITEDVAPLKTTEVYLVLDIYDEMWFFTAPPDDLFTQLPGAKTKYLKIPMLKDGDPILEKRKGVLLPATEVFNVFLGMPLDGRRQSPSVTFLSLCTSIALALVRSSSFIPEVVAVEGGPDFIVRYVPLVHDEKIRNAINLAMSFMPPVFAIRTVDNNVLTPEGINNVLSLILAQMVMGFSDAVDIRDKVSSAFFKGCVYKAQAFEELHTAKAISDWLAGLSVRKQDISPVIRLELLADDRFSVHLDVENKKDSFAPLLSLSEVFRRKDLIFSRPASTVKMDVARQIAVAAEHLPQLKAVLNSKGMSPAEIDAETMASFMTRTKGLLDLLGIRIIVPKELKQLTTPRLALRARTKGKGGSISYLSLNEMLDFTWEVSIGGVSLSKSEFLNLVKSAHGVVRFRDQYLLLSPEEVKNILERMRKPPRELSAMEALCSAVTGEHDGMLFNADEALRQLIGDLTRVEDVEVPAGLTACLRPYQERGFRWLCSNARKGFGSCMADDMGLGKTIQVIAFLLKLKSEGDLAVPALVVCPTTIVGNWEKECRRFAPSLNVFIYHGSERSLAAKNKDLVITTYGTFRRDIEKFSHREWRALIVDEAQNIKNPDTDQARAIKSLNAGIRIAMSGTPVENRLSELWSIFDFINRGYLGQALTFQKKYAVPIEKYRDKDSIERLRAATAPFILRRLKSDKSVIEDLPDKIVSDEYCYLTKEQAALYQQVVDGTMETIEASAGIQRKGLIFKLITSLKQICNHPVHYSKKGEPRREESGKAERALDLAGKVLSLGQKALIFTQYKEMGNLLTALFAREFQEEVLFFHGGLTRKKRDEMIDIFQEKESGGVMVISLKAGGTGLNLTAAAHVIHYDLWWNPAVEDQATDRAYRIGQTANVMVHRLITLGTFEERIDEMLKSKKELADLTITAGEQWLTELSDKELKNLFSLAGLRAG
jgi:uncharacterized Zn finger protein/superfamily II DNA or RNA helicase